MLYHFTKSNGRSLVLSRKYSEVEEKNTAGDVGRNDSHGGQSRVWGRKRGTKQLSVSGSRVHFRRHDSNCLVALAPLPPHEIPPFSRS
jgi:hypothetical protein